MQVVRVSVDDESTVAVDEQDTADDTRGVSRSGNVTVRMEPRSERQHHINPSFGNDISYG